LGRLHEILESRGPGIGAPTLFAASLLARLKGPVLWCHGGQDLFPDLFPPGLAGVGLSPDRVIHVAAGEQKTVLLAMEEGLRKPGLAGVVEEISSLPMLASRSPPLPPGRSRLRCAAQRGRSRRGKSTRPPPRRRAGASGRCLRRRPAWASAARSPLLDGGSSCCAAAARRRPRGSWRRLMRRVVSIWLPFFPTERLRGSERALGPAPETPFVTVRPEGNRRVVGAADRAARGLGVRPGMALAEAEGFAPGLATTPADPAAEEAALRRLAAWCLRYAPLAAADPPNGLRIDAAGAAHLFGGEAAMLTDLCARLARAGFSARAAIADTPGAAHALARYGTAETILVPPGGQEAALAELPPAALRLSEEDASLLVRLGITRIAALAALPRGPLARRFGASVLHRLEQALGRIAEPITPMTPPAMPEVRLAFAEPIATPEALSHAIARLAEGLCRQLEQSGKGARRLELFFARIDGAVAAVRIGTARPVRDAGHLARLLAERLEEADPGLGVEAMRLQVPLAEPLGPRQTAAAFPGKASEEADLSPLVDRLANRLGAARLYRAAPVESDVPERSVRRVAPLALPSGKTWPPRLPRPARLLSRPEPVSAVALLPDHPPAQFVWRGRRHRVAAGDGPERVFGEWWRSDAETFAVREYFRVEDENGSRYWLFRRGDGADLATGDGSWFLHGFF
ncbi:MAG TPA: DUF6504 family protein, partial [Acetobacteraceae bacterium]|nr:DUF6504 family protein [Acetobacteraceae bacterium]